jgi:N-acetylmuramoyl-L-alanine amidase
MVFNIFRKKEPRIRQIILRGIYEENLKIIGKATRPISEKIPLSFRKAFLSFLVLLGCILGYENYLIMNPFQNESQQLSANLAPQASPSLPDNDRMNFPEYYKSISNPEIPLSLTFGLKVKTIMIDPGHGGSATGAIGKLGTREKDIALDIARKLSNRLQKYREYTVVLTRDQDATMPLKERVDLANASKADLFIAIHLNSLPTKPLNIIETYIFGASSDQKILKLAELENIDSEYRISDFREIIEKISDTLKLQESRKLATSIQKNLFLNIKKQDKETQDYGVKRAPFLVLLGVNVPAVLVEVSCLSNMEEEIKMNKESYRESIAHYIEIGIVNYLTKGEPIYEAKRR